MDTRFIKATTALPTPNRVCGRVLFPFCLRHRVLLESIDSPFLKPEDRSFTARDVIWAIKIISTYDKSIIHKSLSLQERLWVWLLNKSRFNLARTAGFVLGHISNSCSYPKLWSKEENGKKNENIPWTLSCVANNVRNGCSLEEAWTMPEGEAVWMSISHAVYNGAKIDVLSTDEEKELEKFNERIEAYKKSKIKN